MNGYDLNAIVDIIDDIVERRVNEKMKDFFANIKKEYPNLQYDLSKASVGITKSAFDSALSVSPEPEPYYFHSSNGRQNKPCESSFANPSFIVPTGSAFREPPKAEMTLGDYKAQKEHMDVPVSAFDAVAGQECYWDRFNFKEEEYVLSKEEITKLPTYLMGFPEDIATRKQQLTEQLQEHQNRTYYINVGSMDPEKAKEYVQDVMSKHHDKVLDAVLHLTTKE